jgi:hypothetical protein
LRGWAPPAASRGLSAPTLATPHCTPWRGPWSPPAVRRAAGQSGSRPTQQGSLPKRVFAKPTERTVQSLDFSISRSTVHVTWSPDPSAITPADDFPVRRRMDQGPSQKVSRCKIILRMLQRPDLASATWLESSRGAGMRIGEEGRRRADAHPQTPRMPPVLVARDPLRPFCQGTRRGLLPTC